MSVVTGLSNDIPQSTDLPPVLVTEKFVNDAAYKSLVKRANLATKVYIVFILCLAAILLTSIILSFIPAIATSSLLVTYGLLIGTTISSFLGFSAHKRQKQVEEKIRSRVFVIIPPSSNREDDKISDKCKNVLKNSQTLSHLPFKVSVTQVTGKLICVNYQTEHLRKDELPMPYFLTQMQAEFPNLIHTELEKIEQQDVWEVLNHDSFKTYAKLAL